MADYNLYGYSAADVATDAQGNIIPGVQAQVWTSAYGGSVFADTKSVAAGVTPGEGTGGIVTATDDGRITFYASTLETLWLTFSVEGDRYPINPVMMNTIVTEQVAVANATQEGIIAELETHVENTRLSMTSVLDFGAVGDGVTDDSQAFQDAFNYVTNNGGGVLNVPGKTYLLAGTFAPVLKNNITVMAYGATLTKPLSTGFRAMFVANTPNGVDLVYGAGLQNFQWRGGTFLGHIESGDGGTICPFALNNAKDCWFQDITFKHCKGTGGHIFDIGGGDNIRIVNCDFIGQTDAGNNDNVGEAVQIDCSSRGSATGGTALTGFSGLFTRRVTVEGCRFLPARIGSTDYPAPPAMGAHFCVEGKYYEDIQFLNNLVIDPAASAITSTADGSHDELYRGAVHFPTVKRLKVTGNTFKMTKNYSTPAISAHAVKYGVLASSDPSASSQTRGNWATPVVCEDVIIADNIVQGFKVGNSVTAQPTIIVRGLEAASNVGVNIHNNRVSNVYNASATNLTSAAAIVSVCNTQAVVSGNTVDGCDEALRIGLSDYVTVSENNITNCAGKGIHLWGIHGGTVTGNMVSKYGGLALQVDGSSENQDVTVTGNNLRGPISGYDGVVLGATSSTRIMISNNVMTTSSTLAAAIGINSGLIDSVIVGNLCKNFGAATSGATASSTSTSGNFVK